MYFSVSKEEPEEPKLMTTKVNLIGVLYTVKLALHYFYWQHAQNKGLDQVLILSRSMAGYLTIPGALEYGASKSAI
jgi:short-subunit dehydrogenase